MKILIVLFAVITFVLMAGDPRREDFESKEFDAKNNEPQQHAEQQHDQEDSGEPS
ncbi:hypothetical protein ACNPQK_20205 [Acinetobacter guillouiae]|jgi:hypothetical protein|uniref:Uncharacterized protein n=2 Tax=Moraxellaceae TaxID=468 RepID=N8WSD1_ACIGI|nr:MULTISPECIES: hypothetical protein [Acinetobacter]ENU57547.1 hypothetical protein F981_03525 [Acinetobacter guillouiae CIP 63.46]ENV14891.1 hypothetical protein F964_04478 [Acinetobacter guillouiae NIPH 991]EPH34582.1 hypothetical protein L291_2388 [Acinetobacter guillouiae MSP4-18]UOH18539.1 hypothetical protein MTO68_22610 [Acinetobacter sp. NyZ410]BAP39212.1 hypothetical protein AS4_42720 [Acinetobacter guillouiae]